jgi:hypothetical protein
LELSEFQINFKNLYDQVVLLSHIQDKDGILDLHLEAEEDQAKKERRAKFSANFNFNSKIFEPSTLMPKLENKIEDLDGSLFLEAEFQQSSEGLQSSSGKVRFDSLNSKLYDVPMRGLNGTIELASLWPLVSKEAHKLSIGRIGDKLPVLATSLEFIFPKEHEFTLKALSSEWAGGKIKAYPFEANLKDPRFKTKIWIDGLELNQLLANSEKYQVRGEGKLFGEIPLDFRSGELVIPRAVLSTKRKGWLKYKDPTIFDVPKHIDDLEKFQKLLERGQQALAWKALDNFLFDKLIVILRRPKPHKTTLSFRLRGSNPEVIQGQAFDISLNLGGQIEDAIIDSYFRAFDDVESWREHYRSLESKL